MVQGSTTPELLVHLGSPLLPRHPIQRRVHQPGRGASEGPGHAPTRANGLAAVYSATVAIADAEPNQGRIDLIVAEYESLRSEILKLIELQSQLVSLAVITLGALLGVAVQAENSSLAFIYPLLGLILGIMWLNHSHAISRCTAYLSQVLEPRCGSNVLGWEAFVRRNPLRFGTLGYWGVRSVFMSSSIAAVLVGWTLVRIEAVLLSLGAIATLVTTATVALFLLWREPSPSELLAEEIEVD